MSLNGERLSGWVTEKKKLARVQQELLIKEFEARESREQELHNIMMQVKQKKLEKLDIEIRLKKAKLQNIGIYVD